MIHPIVFAPMLSGVCVMLTSSGPVDEIRLSYEMDLLQAEKALIDFENAVMRARAWRPDGLLSGVLG